MALYRPPTKVVTIETPYLSLVTAADPEWARRKHREVEYDTPNGRAFVANPYVRGAYNSHSNVYPVGQAFGADDQLVVDNRPLYSGVDDGNGWA